MWVDYKPGDDGYRCIYTMLYMKVMYLNCGVKRNLKCVILAAFVNQDVPYWGYLIGWFILL